MARPRLAGRLPSTCALALATLALSACGNGRLGTQEYLARGDRLCDRVSLTANRFGRPQSLDLLGRKIRAVDGALTKLTTDLRSRRPPTRLDRPSRVYLALVDQRIQADRRLLGAVQAGVKDPIIVLGVRANQLDARLDAAAARVGFQRCIAPRY